MASRSDLIRLPPQARGCGKGVPCLPGEIEPFCASGKRPKLVNSLIRILFCRLETDASLVLGL